MFKNIVENWGQENLNTQEAEKIKFKDRVKERKLRIYERKRSDRNKDQRSKSSEENLKEKRKLEIKRLWTLV